MFCPRCGHERVSEAVSFCSRCGFLLTGTAELLRTDGAPSVVTVGKDSPRRRGVKQGLFMFLLMFVLAPLVGIIATFAIGMRPWPVGVIAAVLGMGGLLRIAYALMFESKYPQGLAEGQRPGSVLPGNTVVTSALPPSTYESPFPDHAADWRKPGDLQPMSVTDNTTKLLEKEDDE